MIVQNVHTFTVCSIIKHTVVYRLYSISMASSVQPVLEVVIELCAVV